MVTPVLVTLVLYVTSVSCEQVCTCQFELDEWVFVRVSAVDKWVTLGCVVAVFVRSAVHRVSCHDV